MAGQRVYLKDGSWSSNITFIPKVIESTGNGLGVGGDTTPYFAVINSTTGVLDSNFTGTTFNGKVNGIHEDAANDRFFVAGAFTSYKGTSCKGLIALNYDGTIDTSFIVSSSLTEGIAIRKINEGTYAGHLYVASNFGYSGGLSILSITNGTRFNYNTSISAYNPVFTSIMESNGALYAAGSFNINIGSGNYTQNIIKFTSGSTLTTIDNNLYSSAYGGQFDRLHNATSSGIRKIYGSYNDGYLYILGGTGVNEISGINGATHDTWKGINNTFNAQVYLLDGDIFLTGYETHDIGAGNLIVFGDFTTVYGKTSTKMVNLTKDGFILSTVTGLTGTYYSESGFAGNSYGIVGSNNSGYIHKFDWSAATIPAATKYKSTKFNGGCNTYFSAQAIFKDGNRIFYTGWNLQDWNSETGNTLADGFVCINSTTGKRDTTWNVGGAGVGTTNINGNLIKDTWSTNKYILAGCANYNGVSTPSRCIRLNTDGTLDTTWNYTGTTIGEVYRVFLIFGGLYVSGSFTQYNGVAVNRLCKLDLATGDVDTTWVTNFGTGANNNVWAATYDSFGYVVIGGQFTEINGTPAGKIATLNTAGILQTPNAHFWKGSDYITGNTGVVIDLQWDSYGSSNIWAVGDFNKYSASPFDVSGNTTGITTLLYNIAKLQTTTHLQTGFHTGANLGVNSDVRKFPDAELSDKFVSGGFDYYNGTPSPSMASFEKVSGDISTTYKFGDTDGENLNTFLVENSNEIYIGGLVKYDGHSISTYDNPLRQLVKLQTTNDYEATYAAVSGESAIITFYSVSGGSGDYEYSIDSGATWQTTSGYTSASSGTHYCYVRDLHSTLNIYYAGFIEVPYSEAPTDLHFVSGGTTYTTAEIAWTNNNYGQGDYNLIQYKDLTYGTNGGDWIDAGQVAISATTYTITGLLPFAEYEIRVVLVGSFYPSNSIFITMPPPIPAFCDGDNYSVSATTCGNSDGQIVINDSDYLLFYDFELQDVEGNTYSFTSSGISSGLTAGYYFLTATVKSFYEVIYGREYCEFDWIPIFATDTTMSLDNTSVRNSICGQFGASAGRIVYFGSDSGTTGSYTSRMYNEDKELIQTVTGTTISQLVFAPLNPDDYYCIVTNNNNDCTLLLGMTQVESETPNAVAGIQRVFVTEWNNLVEYNYWTANDEDYFISGLDSDFFTSIKIKEFIDSTLPTAWFEILLDTKAISYNQTMNKTHQGFIFTDSITITIPHADNAKWKQLVDFLVNRYIIVFKDNNKQWWVMGYRLGAKADSYKRSNNEYILTLNAISDNKILTNIDETYVNDNIINL